MLKGLSTTADVSALPIAPKCSLLCGNITYKTPSQLHALFTFAQGFLWPPTGRGITSMPGS